MASGQFEVQNEPRPLGVAQLQTPTPIERPHAQEGKAGEASEQQHVRKVAIRERVDAGPEREATSSG